MNKLEELTRIINLSKSQNKVSDAIAWNIRAYRIRKHMSQRDLALMSGIAQPYIVRMEKQSYKGYTIALLNKIAFALDVPLERLVKMPKDIDKKGTTPTPLKVRKTLTKRKKFDKKDSI